MINTLQDDPEYANLVRLVRGGSCVAFVGSGLSTSKALYPSWGDLMIRICEACGLPVPSQIESPDANFLLEQADKARNCNEQAYCRVLGEIFGKPVVETRRAYDLLARLSFQSYVTVNFDPLLAMESRKVECGGVYSFPSLPSHRLDKRAFYYLHGYIEPGTIPKANQIILGQQDFDRAYSERDSILSSFLYQLLTYHPILFLGCTLREPPLKRIFESCYRVRKLIELDMPGHKAPPRYALLPIRFLKNNNPQISERDLQGEQEEAGRFQELEIFVLRYDPKDEKHSAIEEILEDWCELGSIQKRSGFEESSKL